MNKKIDDYWFKYTYRGKEIYVYLESDMKTIKSAVFTEDLQKVHEIICFDVNEACSSSEQFINDFGKDFV